MIDHSLLHPTMTDEQLLAGLIVARACECATACVKPYAVPISVMALAGSQVAVCAVAGFPHGNKHLAILCDHKFPGADWPAEEFAPHALTLVHGEAVTMDRAERGTCLTNAGGCAKSAAAARTAGKSASSPPDYSLWEIGPLVGRRCARWGQENFFKSMRANFALDGLAEHGVIALPATTTVVNPAWRRLDQAVRRESALLHRRQAQFGAHTLSLAP